MTSAATVPISVVAAGMDGGRMRIILDVSADADHHIEGTASWANSGRPIQFSGWLALMLLLEQANPGPTGGQPAALSDRPGDNTGGTGMDP